MDLHADFLIIGSGIAGLRAAVELAGAGTVLILTKAEPREGNTGYAQGGIAAAVGPGDSPELHAADTIAAGDGLCDERAVQVLVEEGPGYVRELMAWGAAFDRAADGSPALAIEGAHSARRVLHARDATGREIGRVLWRRASGLPGVETSDHARVVDLVVDERERRCIGARILHEDGTTSVAFARTVLLATGGAGHVYSDTTNPPVATGDGVAMAYRAGAAVSDLEFVQFHPTALKVAGQPRFLLSEALRGEGARLLNGSGEAFMPRYDPAGDLAPRDRVAREHRARGTTHGSANLLVDAASRSGVRARSLPADLECVPRRPVSTSHATAFQWARRRTTSWEASRPTSMGRRRSRACLLREKSRVPASMARTGSPATRSSKGSCSARAPGGLCGRLGSKGSGDSEGSRRSRRKETFDVELNAEEFQARMWRDVGLFRDRVGIASALSYLEPAWKDVDGWLRDGGTLDAESGGRPACSPSDA